MPTKRAVSFATIGATVELFLDALKHGWRELAFYDPPYDSPIEDRFAWSFVKRADRERVRLLKQHWVSTRGGRFRLDFAVVSGTRIIGLECDGERYHDAERDARRDELILETGSVDAIYRFRGVDINRCVDDCLWALSLREPQLFPPHEAEYLLRITPEELKQYEWSGDRLVAFDIDDENPHSDFVAVCHRGSR